MIKLQEIKKLKLPTKLVGLVILSSIFLTGCSSNQEQMPLNLETKMTYAEWEEQKVKAENETVQNETVESQTVQNEVLKIETVQNEAVENEKVPDQTVQNDAELWGAKADDYEDEDYGQTISDEELAELARQDAEFEAQNNLKIIDITRFDLVRFEKFIVEFTSNSVEDIKYVHILIYPTNRVGDRINTTAGDEIYFRFVGPYYNGDSAQYVTGEIYSSELHSGILAEVTIEYMSGRVVNYNGDSVLEVFGENIAKNELFTNP